MTTKFLTEKLLRKILGSGIKDKIQKCEEKLTKLEKKSWKLKVEKYHTKIWQFKNTEGKIFKHWKSPWCPKNSLRLGRN